MKNIRNFCLKILRFLVVNLSVYLNRHVFVMKAIFMLNLAEHDFFLLMKIKMPTIIFIFISREFF